MAEIFQFIFNLVAFLLISIIPLKVVTAFAAIIAIGNIYISRIRSTIRTKSVPQI